MLSLNIRILCFWIIIFLNASYFYDYQNCMKFLLNRCELCSLLNDSCFAWHILEMSLAYTELNVWFDYTAICHYCMFLPEFLSLEISLRIVDPRARFQLWMFAVLLGKETNIYFIVVGKGAWTSSDLVAAWSNMFLAVLVYACEVFLSLKWPNQN